MVGEAWDDGGLHVDAVPRRAQQPRRRSLASHGSDPHRGL